MHSGFEEIVNNNFDFKFKAVAYNNFEIALRCFEEFKKYNKDFFSLEKRETVLGHLRTYAIEKQFCDSAFTPSSCYAASLKEVNKFKYKTLFLETDDFVVSVGRTNKPGVLLPPACYKAEFAKNNAEFNQQLELDLTKEKLDIVSPKKYALLTYGYNLGMLTHLNIVFPDSTYRMSMYEPINLLKDVHIYNGYVSKEVEEESIVALKKSLREEKSIK